MEAVDETLSRPPPRATIISAIYDRYEDLKPICPQVGYQVEWVMVTDDPGLADDPNAEGWRVVVERAPGVHPNRAAKRPKMLPWEYTSTPASVWIDGAYLVTSPTFAVDLLTAAFVTGIAQFRHPWRDCAFEEALESCRLPRYQEERDDIRRQVALNRERGLPFRWGLWATGCIARHHWGEVRQFGEAWHRYITDYTYQDQVSESLALWENGMRPRDLAGNHLTNAWLEHRQSTRHL